MRIAIGFFASGNSLARDHSRAFRAGYPCRAGVRSQITVHCAASTGDRGQRTLPPNKQGVRVSQFRLTDWIVPPIVVPIFLLLLILASTVLHG
jgi:hypothetical protein